MLQRKLAVMEDWTAGSREELSRDEVFARIVAEHGRFLYRVAHGVLRHAQDAEDAVQDALLKLYRGEAWREMREERAFLARVMDVGGCWLFGNGRSRSEREAGSSLRSE